MTHTIFLWSEDQVELQDLVVKRLQKVRERSLKRANRQRKPRVYKVNEYVLIHKYRFDHRKFYKLGSPWLVPFKITAVKESKLSVLTSPTLASNINVFVQHCKSWTPLNQNSDFEDDNDNDEILSVPPSDSAESHLAVRSLINVVEKILSTH